MWTTNPLLYKFDISQDFHHIDIDDKYQKYLYFSLKIDGKISYFIFVVPPFSLTPAPFIFTNVMCSLVKNFEKGSDKNFTYILTTVLDGFNFLKERIYLI